jgi:hypothetical protein
LTFFESEHRTLPCVFIYPSCFRLFFSSSIIRLISLCVADL